ncbi:hypothetical protein BGZ47_002469 [Haplosporangium gracile]|nr:hypothetical protein BGZ47_002469 [Haplosporangium gracile]
MSSLKVRSMAFLAILLCFFTSTVLAGPEEVTVPNVGGEPGSITKITVSGTVVAIVLIAAGFIFAFFGHRFFKITLFLAGFYVFSTLAWIALSNARPGADGYGANTQWVYLGVTAVAGLLGGGLFLCFWRLGFAAIGAIAGFYLAMFILSWSSNGVISNGTGRTIFIIAFVIVGIVLTFFVERHVIILGTAIVGSGSFFIGLDNFVHTGFANAFTAFLSGNKNAFGGNGYEVTGKVYGMLAGTLAMMVLGACFQYYKHRGSWVPKTHRPHYQAQPQYHHV